MGGAAILERMKSEKGNSRGSGSGFGFWVLGEKLSEKLGGMACRMGLARGIIGAVRLLWKRHRKIEGNK